jgi:hydrogenase 3 maturation protease
VRFPLVNGGAAPENYLGVVEAALPEVVLVISAIELGLPAGEIRLLEVQDLAGIASPQGARLQALCRHFEQCCETQVLSLGVQPANPSGARLSPQAAQAMEQVSAALQSLPVAASDPQWVDRFNEMGLFFES